MRKSLIIFNISAHNPYITQQVFFRFLLRYHQMSLRREFTNTPPKDFSYLRSGPSYIQKDFGLRCQAVFRPVQTFDNIPVYPWIFLSGFDRPFCRRRWWTAPWRQNNGPLRLLPASPAVWKIMAGILIWPRKSKEKDDGALYNSGFQFS